MPVDYLKETPSQTAGPYVHIGLMPSVAGLNRRTQENLHILPSASVEGERIRVEGAVIDGSGHKIREAMLEIWQANSKGIYNSREFAGFGRCSADFTTGDYWFETIKPGRVPWIDGRPQAPHLSILVLARGVNIHLHTRMYFADEEAANAEDPLMRSIELQGTVPTLIAQRTMRGSMPVYHFDIRLQGEGETIFFDA